MRRAHVLRQFVEMEDSLFTRPVDAAAPVAASPDNQAVLQALLLRGVGRQIKNDTSTGKKAVLRKLVPRTRGLKRLLNGLEEDGDDIVIRGADDAVEILEVIYGIVNSKFDVQNVLDSQQNTDTDMA